jgi:hypothetical protein
MDFGGEHKRGHGEGDRKPHAEQGFAKEPLFFRSSAPKAN